MAAIRTVTDNSAIISLINTSQLRDLFTSLDTSMQNRVLSRTFKDASSVFIATAKSNFNATKKDTSRTNYSDLTTAFKSRTLRNSIGAVFGMQERGLFKYRWSNYGTAERFTRGNNPRSTGVINPSHFFTNAVNSQLSNAQTIISEGIVRVLNNVLNNNRI